MPNSKETLQQLRRIFRDELEDALGPITAAQTALVEGDEARRREAVAEVFRVVHGLKGAARAVVWPSVERLCDVLEGRLAAAREGRGVDEVAQYAAIAANALRACVVSLDQAGVPDDGAVNDALSALLVGARSPSSVASIPASGVTAATKERAPESARIEARALEATSVRPTDSFAPGRAAEETTRVLVRRLQQLLTATDTVVAQVSNDGDDEFFSEIERLLHDARDAVMHEVSPHSPALTALSAALGRLVEQRRVEHRLRIERTLATRQLLQRARELRVQSVDTLLGPLERVAFDAAELVGKLVQVELSGERIELDRRVLDALKEPLAHIVRNAVDHGIETPDERALADKSPVGTIVVHARIQGTEATITVRDDGRGISATAAIEAAKQKGIAVEEFDHPLQTLFEPGVTTRGAVTALSGRGVGLDVVRQRVARLQGRTSIESTVGQGTSISLTVPLDLSVTHMLFVRVDDVIVALSATSVLSVQRLDTLERVMLRGRPYVRFRGSPVRLTDLSATLALGGVERQRSANVCVFIAAGDRQIALCVQEAIESRDVVLRGLPARAQQVPFVSGTTTLRGGEIALVLDAGALVGLAQSRFDEPASTRKKRHVLVVDDSLTTRQLLRSILESADYRVTAVSDGSTALAILTDREKKLDVDAVVTDIEMPVMDGWQLLARVRAEASLRTLPLVVVTSLAHDSERRRALSLGATAYVSKGRFDQHELLHALDQIVD